MHQTKADYWHLKFWQIPQLDYLGLLHGSRINYDYPLHLHEEYSIALMLGGKETTVCRGSTFTAVPGTILLINAEEAHSSSSQRSEYRIFKITAKALTDIASTTSGRPPNRRLFTDVVVTDKAVFRLLLDLHLNLEKKASALEYESEFVSRMALLLARQAGTCLTAEPARELWCVNAARDYIRAHYTESVSLAKLASFTNLSPFHLLRVFRKQVGCPPHEYQTQVRITQARKLIRDGVSLSNVALETGFVDQSHFSRNFKRIVGIPPGQYSRSKIIQDRIDEVW
jgi:AraC-like DNA-binding protein